MNEKSLSKTSKEVILMYDKGYRIISDGNLVNPSGKIIHGGKNSKGYFTYKYKRMGLPLHRLAAYQKFGIKALQQPVEVRHLDGDSTNNTLENIAIGNHSENMNDINEKIRKKNGKNAGRHNSMLTKEDVKDIRYLREKRKFTYKRLLKLYPVTSKTALSYICNYKTWVG